MTESNQSEMRNEQAAAGEKAHGCGCRGAGPEFTRAFHRIFEPPAGAGEHFRQARIEFWKGIRGLIDYRIERLSRDHQRGTRINVE